MALKFEWDAMDSVVAELLCAVINERLSSIKALEKHSLHVSEWDWGDDVPLVALREISDSRFALLNEDNRIGSGDGGSQLGSSSQACTNNPADLFSGIAGPNGLHLKFHIAYGGSLSCALQCWPSFSVDCGEDCSVGVSIPLQARISKFHLDTILCVDCIDNTVRIWFEPLSGTPSEFSPNIPTAASSASGVGTSESSDDKKHLLADLLVVVVAGFHDETSPLPSRSGSASSVQQMVTAAQKRLEFSCESPLNDTPQITFPKEPTPAPGSTIYSDKEAIGAALQRELRAMLDDWCVFPNCVAIKIGGNNEQQA